MDLFLALEKKAEEAKENVVDVKMETSDAEPVKAVEEQNSDAEGSFIWLIQNSNFF
jgi:hypothetical protein